MNTDRFKFRVWDKEKREYLTGFVISPDGTFAIFNLRFRAFSNPLTERDGYILEQCTGLKDKNGKLIFEGDVVSGSWNTTLVVFWDEFSTSFRAKPLNEGGTDGTLHYYSTFATMKDGKTQCINYEVIGNIHEMEIEK